MSRSLLSIVLSCLLPLFSSSVSALESQVGSGKSAYDLYQEGVKLSLQSAFSDDAAPDALDKACALFKQAAAQGNLDALHSLNDNKCLFKGDHSDHQQYLSYLKQEASQDNTVALYLLSTTYQESDNHNGKELSLKYLQKAANLGFAPALYRLSLWYQYGYLVPADKELSLSYLKQAADKGLPEALYRSALFSKLGIGGKADHALEGKLLKMAAAQGSGAASYALAEYYSNYDPAVTELVRNSVIYTSQFDDFKFNNELSQQYLVEADQRLFLKAKYKIFLPSFGQILAISSADKQYPYHMQYALAANFFEPAKTKYFHLVFSCDHDKFSALKGFEDAAEEGDYAAKFLVAKFSLELFKDKQDEIEKASKLLQEVGDSKISHLQRQVAELFESNPQIKNHDELAFKYYNLAAQRDGDPAIKWKLAIRLMVNNSGATENSLAIKYMKDIAYQHPFSAVLLDALYDKKRGVYVALNKLEEHYKKAASQGDLHAMFACGILATFTQDHKLYDNYIKMAADKGYAMAQYCLAAITDIKNKYALSASEALEYLQQAAKSGNVYAQGYLGIGLLKGEAASAKDVEQGIKLLKLAAAQGNAFAQVELGKAYDNNGVAHVDMPQAIKYYEMAAHNGERYAMYKLFEIYRAGNAVVVDMSKAFKYAQMIYDSGDIAIAKDLAFLYLRGAGVEQNKEQAFKYLKELADEYDEQAQFYVGLMYSTGEGTKSDLERSRFYLKKAAAIGDYDAVEELKACGIE